VGRTISMPVGYLPGTNQLETAPQRQRGDALGEEALLSAFEAVLTDVGQHPAAEAGTDQVVDFQPQILAACKALTVLDAAKIGQRLLRQRFQGTGKKRVLFQDRNAPRLGVYVKPPDVAAVYGFSPKTGLFRACREDFL